MFSSESLRRVLDRNAPNVCQKVLDLLSVFVEYMESIPEADLDEFFYTETALFELFPRIPNMLFGFKDSVFWIVENQISRDVIAEFLDPGYGLLYILFCKSRFADARIEVANELLPSQVVKYIKSNSDGKESADKVLVSARSYFFLTFASAIESLQIAVSQNS